MVAVYRVATEAIAQARKGNGATLIECSFDHRPGHSEIGPRKAQDPILKMEAYLTRKGLFSEEWKAEAEASLTKELEAVMEAVQRALQQ